MNFIDIVILAWLIAAALRGYTVGFIRHLLSFVGFLSGLIVGGWLAPYLLQLSDGLTGLGIAVITTLVLAAILAGTGDGLAMRLQAALKIRLAHLANSALGVFTGALFVLLSSWLLASALTRLPFASLSLMIERSAIVQTINKVLPTAPPIIDQLGQLAAPYGLPEISIGPEPAFDASLSPVGPEVAAAAAKAEGSTVRVEGFACGGIATGSGFITAPNYVVTNAHVVAGMTDPVLLNQGQRQRATTVWFDPNTDLAVLRTDRPLPGTPLTLAGETQPRGSSVAILGYPGGGSLRVSPGVILRSQLAVGRDIYGGSISSRQIYALQVDIEQGNSGGPVVLPDGRVAGVIFGKAVTHDGVGYALTSESVAADISEALTLTAPASNGRCE